MGFLAPKVKSPPPRDVGKEYSDTLRAQRELEMGIGRFADLGPLVEQEREMRPKWLDLEADTLRHAAERMLPTYTQTIQPQLSAAEIAANRAQREADLADIETYGARATEATLAASPKLRDALEARLSAATESMNKPRSLRNFRQNIAGEQARRGVAYSPFAAAESAYKEGVMEEQLDMARQANLSQAVGQYSAFVNPWQQVLGRPGQTFGAMGGYGGQAMGLGQSMGSKIFQPESQYAADVYGSNQQTALAVAQGNAANKAAMIGGLMNLGGSAMVGAGHAQGFGKLFG